MKNISINLTPRVKIIQKIYSKILNPDEEIIYNKSQYKKFIKDVTEGTLERSDYIEELIKSKLKDDIDLKRTDKLLKIIIFAAVFELMYKHNNSKKVIISEYLKTSQFFFGKSPNQILKCHFRQIISINQEKLMTKKQLNT